MYDREGAIKKYENKREKMKRKLLRKKKERRKGKIIGLVKNIC